MSEWNSDFYYEDGHPKSCFRCKGGRISGKVVATAGDQVAAEIEYKCDRCLEVLGYWAYGAFDPAFKEIEPVSAWQKVRCFFGYHDAYTIWDHSCGTIETMFSVSREIEKCKYCSHEKQIGSLH